MRMILATAALAATLLSTGISLAADWNPQGFHDESTLEFRTVNPAGEDHWSTVWFVVLDGEVYVNLGDRAVNRLRENTLAPLVSVRIAETEFERVRVDPAQERQKEVAASIADKYWTGFLVPYRPPSVVMRLRPE